MSNFGLTILFSFTPPESFSDLVSYAALIFSGITVFISIANYRAAKKSAEAAEISAESGNRSAEAAEKSAHLSDVAVKLSKEQTEYMKNDVLNKYLPKLLPSTQNLYYSLTDIISIDSYLTDFKNPTSIHITNVTQGNAYMVSSWLEISQEDLLEYFYKEKSPDYYNTKATHSYNLIFQSNENPSENKLITEILEDNFSTNSITTPTFSKNDCIKSIIRPEESCDVFFPNYVKQVIAHTLYSAYENKDYLHKPQNAIIKLVIQYKTGSQLDSDNFMTRKYLLSFSSIKYSETVLTPATVVGPEFFTASLNFKFLEENSTQVNYSQTQL